MLEIDQFLLSSEAARIAQCAAATVREWTRSGRLPSVSTPTGVRIIRRADLERLLTERGARW